MSIGFAKYIDEVRGLQFLQLTRYGTQLLIAILLVKLEYSQNEIGQYETFLLISGFVSFFWVSGIINSLLTTFADCNERDQQTLIFNVFLLMVLINTIIVFILYLCSDAISAFTERMDVHNYLNYILIYVLLNNPGFLVEYIYLLKKQTKSLVIYATIIYAIMLICVGVPMIMQTGIIGIMQGMVVFASIKLLWLIIVLVQTVSPKINLRMVRGLVAVALPIMLSLLFSGSAEYIDGFIIKYFLDDASFTVFRYGARELPFVLLIANAFSVAAIPMISEGLKEGLMQLRKRSAGMMHWMFPITIILLLTSEWIFIHVFDDSFRESAAIFNIYLLLIIPRLIFPQTILTGMKKTSFLGISSFLEIIINISLSIYFLQLYGLVGVAYASFIAFVFDKLFLIAVNYFGSSIKPSSYIPFKIYVPYILLTLAIFYYIQG